MMHLEIRPLHILLPKRKGCTELDRTISVEYGEKRGWTLEIRRKGYRVGGMRLPLDKTTAQALIWELRRIT